MDLNGVSAIREASPINSPIQTSYNIEIEIIETRLVVLNRKISEYNNLIDMLSTEVPSVIVRYRIDAICSFRDECVATKGILDAELNEMVYGMRMHGLRLSEL